MTASGPEALRHFGKRCGLASLGFAAGSFRDLDNQLLA
jgi:hypothetical protein